MPVTGMGSIVQGMLPLFYLASADASSLASCPYAPPPVIFVEVSEGKATFNTDKSKEELAAEDLNTISPAAGPAFHSEIGGMMRGTLNLSHNMNFERDEEQGCIWLEEVHVQLYSEPHVYIASDFQDQACWFGEIFGHELKHIETDRAVMERWALLVEEGLRMALESPEDYMMAGPSTDYGQLALEQSVHNALGVVFEQMMRSRNNAQQETDSPQEYRRLSGGC